jgi:transcriptional regulator with XRE-family HTH domain
VSTTKEKMNNKDNLTATIAQTLKRLRQQRGWSLDAASQKTGVSKAMLGQIERGESSPTIATLWKIASGFDTSFSSFIEAQLPEASDSQPPQGNFLHRNQQQLQQIHQQDDKIKVMPIFPFDATLGFEVFIIELLPGCEHLSPPHQVGVVEHIIVASGSIEVLLDGAWHSLQRNEGMRFAADKPHGYRNLTKKAALFHDMIHYPKSE